MPEIQISAPYLRVPFVDLAAQTLALEKTLSDAIGHVMRQADFILGAPVERFERAFADYIDVPYAIGCASGLDALRMSLLALDVGPGQEVILPANSFIATALAVSSVGARPVLVDCDDTCNLDAAQLDAALSPRTRAIIPVHLLGQPANMTMILAWAAQHGLHVVEDACQAHGALHGRTRCGALGTTGCFSFYPAKNLGAAGDGGLITTRDAALAERLRRLRNYGQESKHWHVEAGLNSRLDTLQAAILEIKLQHLETWNARRREHAAAYRERLRGIGDLRFPEVTPDSTHVYHLFVIATEQRDSLREWLDKCGVQTGLHYPTPIHLQPAYECLRHEMGHFPCAERWARQCLSLPMFPELSSAQLTHVTDAISRFFGRA